MTSSYIRRSSYKAITDSMSSIELIFASIKVVDATGEVEIRWPKDVLGNTVSAEVGDEVWCSGKTKNVYKVSAIL